MSSPILAFVDGEPWQSQGPCSKDPDAMHPDPKDRRLVQAAKLICAGCPQRIKDACLAAHVGEPHGVFGGLTAYEREQLRKQGGL